MIIWGFPKLPWVEFEWLEFPDLPHFHLPCIKIFAVRIAGDCPSPQFDDDGGEHKKSDSSTKTCSVSISVSDCKVGCSLSYYSIVSSLASSTVYYTTSYYRTFGCNLEPTTSFTVSTPSVSSGALFGLDVATPYDAMASFSSPDIPIPLWMQGATLPLPTSGNAATVPSMLYISYSTQQPDPDQGITT